MGVCMPVPVRLCLRGGAHRTRFLCLFFLLWLFSRQFHGYGSGKKKQEKRLKLVAEEKKKERAMDLQRLRYELSRRKGGSAIHTALPLFRMRFYAAAVVVFVAVVVLASGALRRKESPWQWQWRWETGSIPPL